MSSSNTSTLKVRTSPRPGDDIVRTRPSGVSSQLVSAGVTTFLRCWTPGVHSCDHSTRGPNRSGSVTGPLRPCWIRPRYIQAHLAFMTRQVACSSYGLKWRCTESVCTSTRSPCDQS
jgi:hypothetical protein